MKPFPCTKCGLCCKVLPKFIMHLKEKRIDAPDAVRELIMEFPYGMREDGSCEKLNSDNTCAVYDDRPKLCRIDENIKAGGTTAQKMFKAQAEFCNKLINLHVPENDREKYYVKL